MELIKNKCNDVLVVNILNQFSDWIKNVKYVHLYDLANMTSAKINMNYYTFDDNFEKKETTEIFTLDENFYYCPSLLLNDSDNIHIFLINNTFVKKNLSSIIYESEYLRNKTIFNDDVDFFNSIDNVIPRNDYKNLLSSTKLIETLYSLNSKLILVKQSNECDDEIINQLGYLSVLFDKKTIIYTNDDYMVDQHDEISIYLRSINKINELKLNPEYSNLLFNIPMITSPINRIFDKIPGKKYIDHPDYFIKLLDNDFGFCVNLRILFNSNSPTFLYKFFSDIISCDIECINLETDLKIKQNAVEKKSFLELLASFGKNEAQLNIDKELLICKNIAHSKKLELQKLWLNDFYDELNEKYEIIYNNYIITHNNKILERNIDRRYDDRRYIDRRYIDRRYDDRRYDDRRYDDRRYIDRRYDDRRYDDRRYDDRRYDDRRYDDRRYDDRRYDDRRHDDRRYDDKRRERGRDIERKYDERREDRSRSRNFRLKTIKKQDILNTNKNDKYYKKYIKYKLKYLHLIKKIENKN